MRALIVDDSKTMQTILGRTVKELGIEVIEAGNGREALAQLEARGPVELSMVDWNMPEMTGIDFVRAVRRLPIHAAMKVIMVTTSSDLDHVNLALSAGANEYLMKPFTKDMFTAKLQLLGVQVGGNE